MVNIYDLQKQGAEIKVKPVATPGDLKVPSKDPVITPNMPGLAPMGSPAPAPEKKVLNVNDLQAQGVPITVKTPTVADKVVNFGKDIVGDAAQGANNINNTFIKAPARTAGQVIANKIQGKNVPISQVYKEQVANSTGGLVDSIPEPDFIKNRGYGSTAADLTTAKGVQRSIGDVTKTALNASMFLPIGPAGAAAKTAYTGVVGAGKTGIIQVGKQLAKEGALYGAGYGFGQGMQDNKDALGVAIDTGVGAATGAVANVALGGAAKGISKVAEKVIPEYASKVLPGQTKNALSESQRNLNKTLDYLTNPNTIEGNLPAYAKNNIEYTRTRFPNLQEEVAIRTGKPIKTVNDKGTIKFQTGEQARVLSEKAYAESEAASEIAKKYDPVASPITSKEMVEKVDGILSTSDLPNTAEVRDQILKILANDFRGVENGEMKVSFADSKRVEAGKKSGKYDPTKGLVDETDAYDILRKAWKEELSNKIKDPQYLTSIQNSADNFELARLMDNLHGKTAVTEKTGVRKVLNTTGDLFKKADLGFINLKFVGHILDGISEIGTAERNLMTKAVEKLVQKSKNVGAKFSDSEVRVLNFIKRMEGANKTGESVEISSGIVNELRNLEHTKQTNEAIKFFNKQFGDEFITSTKIDLVPLVEKFKNADAKGKGDITAKLYKDLLDETRQLNKKPAVPTEKKVDTFMEKPIGDVKNADMEKLKAAQEAKAKADEAKFYEQQAAPEDIIGNLERDGKEMKKEELIQNLKDLAKTKYEAEMNVEWSKQGLEDHGNMLNNVSRKDLGYIKKNVINKGAEVAKGKSMRIAEDLAGSRYAEEAIADVEKYYNMKDNLQNSKEFLKQTKDKYNNTIEELKKMGLSNKAILNIANNIYSDVPEAVITQSGKMTGHVNIKTLVGASAVIGAGVVGSKAIQNFPKNSATVEATPEQKQRNSDAADKIFGNGKVQKEKVGEVLHNIEGANGKADFTGYASTRVAKIPTNGLPKEFKYKVGYAKEFGITPIAIAQLIKEKKYTEQEIQNKILTKSGASEVATKYFLRGLDPEKDYSVEELVDHYVKNYVTSGSPFYDKKSVRNKMRELLKTIQK